MSDSEQRADDVCPECGCVGRFVGETTGGGSSVGTGAPMVVEHWECWAENCETRWTS